MALSPDNNPGLQRVVSRRGFLKIAYSAALLAGGAAIGSMVPNLGNLSGAPHTDVPPVTPTPALPTPTPGTGKGKEAEGKGKTGDDGKTGKGEDAKGKGKDDKDNADSQSTQKPKSKNGYTSNRETPFSTDQGWPFDSAVARGRGVLTAYDSNSFLALYDQTYGTQARQWELQHFSYNSSRLPDWKGWCQGQANAGTLKQPRPQAEQGATFKGASMQSVLEVGLAYMHRADPVVWHLMEMKGNRALVMMDQLVKEIQKGRYATVELTTEEQEALFFRTAYDVSPDGLEVLVTNFGKAPIWTPRETIRWAHIPRHFQSRTQGLGIDSMGKINTIAAANLRRVQNLVNPEIDEARAWALIYPGKEVPTMIDGKEPIFK